jgi:hypothetical protein
MSPLPPPARAPPTIHFGGPVPQHHAHIDGHAQVMAAPARRRP